jgi:cell fate regulator YaaT (PSP1 superfamily)
MEENTSENAKKEEAATAPETLPKSVSCVGIQFRTASKLYTFVTTENDLSIGDAVVVESDDGNIVGFVAAPVRQKHESELPKNVKKVLRRASAEEIAERAGLREKALEHFEVCRKKILEHRLDMKLVDAEVAECGKKIIFFFYAEQRVDFRGLVKEMAGILHMRIEMRQIGARDESKFIGCLGPCGLETCCSAYLRQFKSISISMAKQQGLTPNPTKLTGMCGKLKCCLEYEQEAYAELRKGMPKLGLTVETPKGPGRIVDMNMLKRECTVQVVGGPLSHFGISELKPIDRKVFDEAMRAKNERADAAEEKVSRRREREDRRGKRNDRREGDNGREDPGRKKT